jgi:hypothetical protein
MDVKIVVEATDWEELEGKEREISELKSRLNDLE